MTTVLYQVHGTIDLLWGLKLILVKCLLELELSYYAEFSEKSFCSLLNLGDFRTAIDFSWL